MNFSKKPLLAAAFAITLGATACTTTDTGSGETENLMDSTEMSAPDTNDMTDTTMNEGTGGDTTMNNDGMRNEGGAVIDSNNVPNEDGRVPVRGRTN